MSAGRRECRAGQSSKTSPGGEYSTLQPIQARTRDAATTQITTDVASQARPAWSPSTRAARGRAESSAKTMPATRVARTCPPRAFGHRSLISLDRSGSITVPHRRDPLPGVTCIGTTASARAIASAVPIKRATLVRTLALDTSPWCPVAQPRERTPPRSGDRERVRDTVPSSGSPTGARKIGT